MRKIINTKYNIAKVGEPLLKKHAQKETAQQRHTGTNLPGPNIQRKIQKDFAATFFPPGTVNSWYVILIFSFVKVRKLSQSHRRQKEFPEFLRVLLHHRRNP